MRWSYIASNKSQHAQFEGKLKYSYHYSDTNARRHLLQFQCQLRKLQLFAPRQLSPKSCDISRELCVATKISFEASSPRFHVEFARDVSSEKVITERKLWTNNHGHYCYNDLLMHYLHCTRTKGNDKESTCKQNIQQATNSAGYISKKLSLAKKIWELALPLFLTTDGFVVFVVCVNAGVWCLDNVARSNWNGRWFRLRRLWQHTRAGYMYNLVHDCTTTLHCTSAIQTIRSTIIERDIE